MHFTCITLCYDSNHCENNDSNYVLSVSMLEMGLSIDNDMIII